MFILKAKTNFSKHFLGLSVIFILGNAIIVAPQKNANRYNFLGFLIACLISIAIYFICLNIKINSVTNVFIVLLSAYCIGEAFVTFIGFIKNDLLNETRPFLIALPLLVILIFIAFQKTSTLFKFSLISGLISLLVILFFFFSTLKDFNIQNIFIRKIPSLSTFYKQTLPYIKNIVLPSISLAFFAKQEKIKKTVSLYGLLLGLTIFGICILNSVLLFGIEFSGRLDYPYASTGSTVTFGNLFSRMDGFLYFVYLASCVVKCSVAIFLIKDIIKNNR